MTNPYPRLRWLANAEGCSFLALLGIAMPLKYMAGLPLAVLITGSIHGALFLAFAACWAHTWSITAWSPKRAATVFAAALVPLGPFLLHRDLRAWELEHLQQKPEQGAGSKD